MLMMRLQRVGRKNDPSFRVVITDKRNGPRAGNHVDTIGSYNPKLSNFQIDAEKAKHWLSKGVQPSDTVYNFLISKGIIEGKKRNVLPRKSPIVKDKEENIETEEKKEKKEETEESVEETSTEEEKTEEVEEIKKEDKGTEEEKSSEKVSSKDGVEKEKIEEKKD